MLLKTTPKQTPSTPNNYNRPFLVNNHLLSLRKDSKDLAGKQGGEKVR